MLRKLSCPSELAVRDRATSPINYTCSTDAGFQWCSFQTIFQPEAAAKYKVSPLAHNPHGYQKCMHIRHAITTCGMNQLSFCAHCSPSILPEAGSIGWCGLHWMVSGSHPCSAIPGGSGA